MILASGAVKKERKLDDPYQRQRLELWRYAKNTTIGGRLKDTVGIARRFILLVRFAVSIVRVAVVDGLTLVEKVVHPVGRGVD
jgi:hypothetical protein